MQVTFYCYNVALYSLEKEKGQSFFDSISKKNNHYWCHLQMIVNIFSY